MALLGNLEGNKTVKSSQRRTDYRTRQYSRKVRWTGRQNITNRGDNTSPNLNTIGQKAVGQLTDTIVPRYREAFVKYMFLLLKSQ